MVTPISAKEILRWYIDAGADEAVAEEPVCRYAALPARESANDRISRAAPAPSQEPPRPAPVLSMSHPAGECRTLEELERALAAYDGCALKKTCQRTVFADGNPKAEVMLIGEAPGADEDRLGLPFVGASGRLLDRMLASIGLDRQSCYITNVVPWRPPGNRKPEQAEVEQCLPFLRRHIELAAPRYLLLLGGAPATTLLGRADAISRLRGRWYDYQSPGLDGPIAALPTFHPAYLLRTPAHKRLAWADFRALNKRMTGRD